MKERVKGFIEDCIRRSFQWIREGQRAVGEIKEDVEWLEDIVTEEWDTLKKDEARDPRGTKSSWRDR